MNPDCDTHGAVKLRARAGTMRERGEHLVHVGECKDDVPREKAEHVH
jgi:hypothetical protein